MNKIETATFFIGGTLNDMRVERDILLKEVIPELREWCFKRNICLNVVDLLWDITEENDVNNDIVDIILRYIDKCRPFYICFLGQRRGWVPNLEQEISKKTITDYPDIQRLDGLSVTEIEIEHALLAPLYRMINYEEYMCPPTRHSLFFFRDDEYVKELSPAQRNIYTNSDADDTEHEDKKLAQTKEDIQNRKKEEDEQNLTRTDNDKVYINITDYKGTWDKSKEVHELSHYNDNVSQGRLTNFKCGDTSLKEVLISQLEEQIALAFPNNAGQPVGLFKEPLTIEVKNISLKDIHVEENKKQKQQKFLDKKL